MAEEPVEFEYWIGIPTPPEFEPITIPQEYQAFTTAQKNEITRTGRELGFRNYETFVSYLLEQEMSVYDVLKVAYG